jgi:hypothetical protein
MAEFRLKMWDPATGEDKGWLGVSEGDNVQLFADSDKSRAAICQWEDAGNELFYLRVNNATVVRWLGVGDGNVTACWGTRGGWYNKVSKDNNVIRVEGDRRGLVPSDNGWGAYWGNSNILQYVEVFVPKSPFYMKLRIAPGDTYSLKLTQDDPGGNGVYTLHPTDDARIATLDRFYFDRARFDVYSQNNKRTSGQIEMVSNGTDTFPLDRSGLLKFNYNAKLSTYPDNNIFTHTHFYDIELSSPPVISNANWYSGMANDTKHWVQDYGVDERARWSPETDGFIYQSTTAINSNFGSRAYPIDFPYAPKDSPVFLPMVGGPGVAHEGLWQICMKIGSNGAQDNPFTESFYIAERADIFPGPARYTDGGSTATSTREIDIFETKWSSYYDRGKSVARPHINLPNRGGTSWNPNAGQGDKDKEQYGMTNRVNPGWWPKFEEVGGAPTKAYFIIVGCLIRGDKLWLYAYHDSGKKQWYCTKPIQHVSGYQQRNPFVPYIGTWCGRNNKTPGGFKTGFGGYVYLPSDDKLIKDKNPYDHPDTFGLKVMPTDQIPRAS